jgi:uncharacterized membrane protein YtjA (UPF0391 family)
MELMLTLALMAACFGFGWIVGHATGYERGRDER